MLPFCDSVDLIEFAASNVAWLKGQIPRFGDNWDTFWTVYAERAEYARLTAPRADFARKVTVSRGSVFELPRRRWDLDTLFFVACSLSTDMQEFHAAVHSFAGSLKTGAPFATAFMADSQGYFVRQRWFPAVAIDIDEVRRCLASVAYDVCVRPIDIGDPLRDGYDGMIVATGRVADVR